MVNREKWVLSIVITFQFQIFSTVQNDSFWERVVFTLKRGLIIYPVIRIPNIKGCWLTPGTCELFQLRTGPMPLHEVLSYFRGAEQKKRNDAARDTFPRHPGPPRHTIQTLSQEVFGCLVCFFRIRIHGNFVYFGRGTLPGCNRDHQIYCIFSRESL